MKKAAIVIDTWKFNIFQRRLTEAGYRFERTKGPEDTFILTVETDKLQALAQVILQAQQEAAKTKGK